ncbi:MAG: glycosyl transferase [Duncaniella sp.]|nr:glycosyl transferase [Duncaniella sp.]
MKTRFFNRVGSAVVRRYFRWLDDKTYLKLLYFFEMGHKLDLITPKTFNEKLQWLKLYNHDPLYTKLVDKIEVKKWVAEKIGEEHIIPTLATWNCPEDIDITVLPKKFVLKCNHTGGNNAVFLVKDKNTIDLETIRKKIASSLDISVYSIYREWPYKSVKPRIMAEMLLEAEDNGVSIGLVDYKFFCFNGRADNVMICIDREIHESKFYFFDKDWNLLRYNIRGKNAPANFTVPRPKNLDKMFEIAETLSKGMPFARVDLYNADGKIYFGEITFFPNSGLDKNILVETDELFGNMLSLPESKL